MARHADYHNLLKHEKRTGHWDRLKLFGNPLDFFWGGDLSFMKWQKLCHNTTPLPPLQGRNYNYTSFPR